jgi:hypothetical protein
VELDKSIKKSISFPPGLLESALGRATSDHAGNLSRYLQVLIERDLSGDNEPDPLSPTIIVDLARRLCGEMDAADIALRLESLGQVAQSKLLRNLLEHVAMGQLQKELMTRPLALDPAHSASTGSKFVTTKLPDGKFAITVQPQEHTKHPRRLARESAQRVEVEAKARHDQEVAQDFPDGPISP